MPRTWPRRWCTSCRAGAIPSAEDSERIITRAPSAELRPDQKDQDSLPEYEVLDAIMQRYVEQNRSADEIIAEGFPRRMCAKWCAR